MIRGRVERREAWITLEILDHAGTPHSLDDVVDTGYDGMLTLPSRWIAVIQPEYAGTRRGTLADGSSVALTVYLATIVWHGRERVILVAPTKDVPLAGMALLEGSRVTIDVAQEGPVLIEELNQ